MPFFLELTNDLLIAAFTERIHCHKSPKFFMHLFHQQTFIEYLLYPRPNTRLQQELKQNTFMPSQNWGETDDHINKAHPHRPSPWGLQCNEHILSKGNKAEI